MAAFDVVDLRRGRYAGAFNVVDLRRGRYAAAQLWKRTSVKVV